MSAPPQNTPSQIGGMLASALNARNDNPRNSNYQRSEPDTFGRVLDFDSMASPAERAGFVADDLVAFARAATNADDAVSRWQAVAVVRQMAGMKWAELASNVRQNIA